MRKALASYTPQVVNTTESTIKRWHNSTLDIANEILHLVNCVFGKVIFSLDFHQQDPAFGYAIIRRRQQVNRQFNKGATFLEFFTHFNVPSLGQTLLYLEQQTQQMIQARQVAPDQYQDLLSMFVNIQSQSGGTMTDAQLCDEALSTTGGYETIAAVVIWTYYLLSTHPQLEAQF